MKAAFSRNILEIKDTGAVISQVTAKLKNDITAVLGRRGAIVGISGGIDSSVSLALAVKAMGAQNVLGIMMPEKDSSGDSKEFALKLAEKFGVQTLEENITGALNGFGCYERRDEAVKRIFPEYDPAVYKMKIGIKQNMNSILPPVFSLTVIDGNGISNTQLLPVKEYLQIVAASNFKQRCRMSMLYYHADRLHYAVVGTPNKHEVEQGFFVKHGDGAADVMPIAHFYKTQVYQLAHELGIPEEIIRRTPTTDTYSAEQTQEEFFFQMPFSEMDLAWYGYENGYDPAEVGAAMSKTPQEIEAVYKSFTRKQKTTEYLRMQPIKES